jgi:hypothetical protein
LPSDIVQQYDSEHGAQQYERTPRQLGGRRSATTTRAAKRAASKTDPSRRGERRSR